MSLCLKLICCITKISNLLTLSFMFRYLAEIGTQVSPAKLGRNFRLGVCRRADVLMLHIYGVLMYLNSDGPRSSIADTKVSRASCS